jgi:uncharacterized protein
LKTVASLLALALLLVWSPARPQESGLEPLSAFPKTLLAIRTRGGNVHNFRVWVADRPNRMEQGLMFVRKLEDHTGMIFVYPAAQHASFWMKNTFIPLDMLFIRSDGTIVHIAANATPQSLDLIDAPDPIRAVLELDGGMAGRLGIQDGDKVYTDALPTPDPRLHTRVLK